MTAAPGDFDGDLGLNLVFESAPKMLSPDRRAPTKKRKNKYDRRREKGRLAKVAKMGPSPRFSDVASGVVSQTEPAQKSNDACVLNHAKVTNDGVMEVREIGRPDVPPQTSESSVPGGLLSAFSCKGDSAVSQVASTTPNKKTNVGATKHTVQLTPSLAAPTATQMTSSRRNKAKSTLSDQEQRALYLSEFHARPRDLDRNENASREIKVSLPSDHIFDNENAVGMQVTEADDKSLDGNMKVDQKLNCQFRKLGLHPSVTKAITNPDGCFRLTQPTIVQSRAIKSLLPSSGGQMKGNLAKFEENLFIQSETGSGKTLAYLLPLLQHLAVDFRTQALKKVDRQIGGTRAIILTPTRELATQTYTVANHLCSKSFPWIVPGCFSGGEKRKSEKARLRKGITILIATPGRLLDHLCKTESLMIALRGKLEWFVLDEADRLLDAGLGGQVEQVVQHLRSNQPGAGLQKNGVTWRSVLVSATVTGAIEELAKTVLGGKGWKWARGHNENLITKHGLSEKDQDIEKQSCHELVHSAPRQLSQLYMVVSAKLRLSTLVAFLASRASKGERTIVFMSTCDGVDYHHALFTSMPSIFGDEHIHSDGKGIFGKSCPVYKLHGDVPHSQRQATLNDFAGAKGMCEQKSAILIATDVAARGLNLQSLDWIVQYDPPCETNDYIHRAGRSARAGKSGHSVLFLLPSERQYVEVLQLRGLNEITALSLSATLNTAAGLCPTLTQEGETKSSGNTFPDGRGEAFTIAIQNRLEQCVIQDDLDYKADIERKTKDAKQRRKVKNDVVGPLLSGARRAFSAFVRAYPAKEKAVRHIFNARGLHLGHIARSLGLKETPKMVSKAKYSALNGGENGKRTQVKKRESRLAFKTPSLLGEGDIDVTSHTESGTTKKRIKGGGEQRATEARNAQQRMMEQAKLLQSQGLEFM
ncbi:hypothetical protein HJC23_011825 [Cyclotella cryptica]|uniref:ATP-dependent RNA helicase n=1 Tax=Cyclotella cryptica TaxID=29204 RepID=A0ABD3QFF6_9STRA